MELKDSAVLTYAAAPIALDVDILQNGAMNILRELANLKLINISYKQKPALKDSDRDLEIINENAEYLNSEALDALSFQVDL
jgi:hypothetical protein